MATMEPVGDPGGGGPVMVEFTLTNRGTEAVSVLSWYTPAEGLRSDVFTVTRGGEQLHYRGIMAKRLDPPREAYLQLGPGESHRVMLDLTAGYGVKGAGDYSVVFDGVLDDVAGPGAALPVPVGDQQAHELGPVITALRIPSPE